MSCNDVHVLVVHVHDFVLQTVDHVLPRVHKQYNGLLILPYKLHVQSFNTVAENCENNCVRRVNFWRVHVQLINKGSYNIVQLPEETTYSTRACEKNAGLTCQLKKTGVEDHKEPRNLLGVFGASSSLIIFF